MAAGSRAVAIMAGVLFLLPIVAGQALGQGGGARGATPVPPATGAAGQSAPAHAARRALAGRGGPIATLPGFEMLADGASRLFVELTQTVPVVERRAGRRVTYVLKGAHIAKRNNANALVTVHFNTPVARARLLPGAGGLDFVVEMRADVVPIWKVTPAKNNGAILEIVFPKGSYVPSTSEPGTEPAGDEGNDSDTETDAQSDEATGPSRSPKSPAPPNGGGSSGPGGT